MTCPRNIIRPTPDSSTSLYLYLQAISLIHKASTYQLQLLHPTLRISSTVPNLFSPPPSSISPLPPPPPPQPPAPKPSLEADSIQSPILQTDSSAAAQGSSYNIIIPSTQSAHGFVASITRSESSVVTRNDLEKVYVSLACQLRTRAVKGGLERLVLDIQGNRVEKSGTGAWRELII